MSDNTEKRELAQEAAQMLGKDHVYGKAVLATRKLWFNQLMQEGIGSEASWDLHAKLKALDAVTDQLQIFINDYRMAQGRAK